MYTSLIYIHRSFVLKFIDICSINRLTFISHLIIANSSTFSGLQSFSMVEAWTIAYTGQGLPVSGALHSALRLWDMTSKRTGRRRIAGFWGRHHPPQSTRASPKLCATRGTAAPPLPYTYTDTTHAKKDPLVRSCCKRSWRWTDQGPISADTTSHVAWANWRPVEDVGNHDKLIKLRAPCIIFKWHSTDKKTSVLIS